MWFLFATLCTCTLVRAEEPICSSDSCIYRSTPSLDKLADPDRYRCSLTFNEGRHTLRVHIKDKETMHVYNTDIDDGDASNLHEKVASAKFLHTLLKDAFAEADDLLSYTVKPPPAKSSSSSPACFVFTIDNTYKYAPFQFTLRVCLKKVDAQERTAQLLDKLLDDNRRFKRELDDNRRFKREMEEMQKQHNSMRDELQEHGARVPVISPRELDKQTCDQEQTGVMRVVRRITADEVREDSVVVCVRKSDDTHGWRSMDLTDVTTNSFFIPPRGIQKDVPVSNLVGWKSLYNTSDMEVLNGAPVPKLMSNLLRDATKCKWFFLGFRKPRSQTEYASDTKNPYAYGAYGLRQTLVLTDFTDIKDYGNHATGMSSKWKHPSQSELTLCNGIYWHGDNGSQRPLELADSQFTPLGDANTDERKRHCSSLGSGKAVYECTGNVVRYFCEQHVREGKNRLILGRTSCFNSGWNLRKNNDGMVAELYCDA